MPHLRGVHETESHPQQRQTGSLEPVDTKNALILLSSLCMHTVGCERIGYPPVALSLPVIHGGRRRQQASKYGNVYLWSFCGGLHQLRLLEAKRPAVDRYCLVV